MIDFRPTVIETSVHEPLPEASSESTVQPEPPVTATVPVGWPPSCGSTWTVTV